MAKMRELPDIGTELTGKYLGKQYKAKVVKAKNFSDQKAIKFKTDLYPSMTAAAQAISRSAVNGWRFWRY